jgi:hypothetical protein
MRSLAAAILLASAAALPAAGQSAAARSLPVQDRIRLAEALRLAEKVPEEIWPGWGGTPLPVLLVTDSAEFLIGHPRPSGEFRSLGRDTLLGREVFTRPRRFSPDLLATFPAVGGVPTVVVGTAERTGKSSAGWVATLLHEHFHQWQYSLPGYNEGVAALNLAGGDSTGRWMLDYPFPYDSVSVQRAVRALAKALARAVEAPEERRAGAVRAVIEARDALRGSLRAADWRYLEFQFWQEGTARYVERAVARRAARFGEPAPEFQRLPDYEGYDKAAAADHLSAALLDLDLGAQQRVAFYPLGDALARVLDQTRAGWKRAYTERPFALAALLR